jgi:hypothetical protein
MPSEGDNSELEARLRELAPMVEAVQASEGQLPPEKQAQLLERIAENVLERRLKELAPMVEAMHATEGQLPPEKTEPLLKRIAEGAAERKLQARDETLWKELASAIARVPVALRKEWAKLPELFDKLPDPQSRLRAHHHPFHFSAPQRLRRSRAWGLGLVGVCGCIILMVVMVSKHRTARDYASKIDNGVTNNQAAEVYRQVQNATNHYAGKAPAALAGAMGRGETYLSNQTAISNELEQAANRLEASLMKLTLTGVNTFTNEMNGANKLLTGDKKKQNKGLSKQWSKGLELRLIRLEDGWETFLDQQQTAGEQAMETVLFQVKQNINDNFTPNLFWSRSEGKYYEPHLGQLELNIGRARSNLDTIAVYADASFLDIPNGTIENFRTTERIVDERLTDLIDFREANGDLAEAKTFEKYRQIIRTIQRSNLSNMDERGSLKKVLESNLGAEKLYQDDIIRQLVFNRNSVKFNITKTRKSALVPTNNIPLDVVKKLRRADKDPYIYGVREWVAPVAALIPEISSENTFTNFYQTFEGNGDSPYKYFGHKGAVKLNSWPAPYDGRWDPGVVNRRLKAVPIIQQNEAFEQVAGISKSLVVNGQRISFKAPPLDYIEDVCRQISNNKLEPVIGLWKLTQFSQTLFPENNIWLQKPAVGAHYWEYGVPDGFIQEFNRDLKQAYHGGRSDVASSSWVKYFPLGSRGKKPSEEYVILKKEIIEFANKYARCATQMKELRALYFEVMNRGVIYVGYHRQGNNYLLASAPFDKPLIGLTGPGIWGSIPREGEEIQLLGLTPLFVLATDYGGRRKLPGISRSWHQFPAVLQYFNINK